ncbi:unnamed protein product [Polarella glacialis]|uniref:Uncharacterized protein n=1 Tax=Polarella glacialis TaxID=89957 RepID=A0A813F3H2_POLGL|nr:unnamed protein product [Polarella glacialis]
MKSFLRSLLLLGCSCPAESASWALAKFTDGSSCSGTPQGGEEPGFPMLLDSCELSFRGTSDKSKWTWTKATCSATEVTRIGYTDDKCTIPRGDSSSFDQKWPMACTSTTVCGLVCGLAERSITCGSVHDVVIAKAYMIEPPAPASGCSERSLVSHLPIIIGACYIRLDDTSSFVGMKAACDGQKVVMNKYAALDCSGTGTEFFSFGGTCAQGFNKNGYLAIESGCGNSSGTTTAATTTPTTTTPTTTARTTTTLSSSSSPSSAPSVSKCGMIALPNFLALTWLLIRCLV